MWPNHEKVTGSLAILAKFMRILLIPDLLTLPSNGPTLLPLKLLASVYDSSLFCTVNWYPLHHGFPMAVLLCWQGTIFTLSLLECAVWPQQYKAVEDWVLLLTTVETASTCHSDDPSLTPLGWFSSPYDAKLFWKPWVSFSIDVVLSEESGIVGFPSWVS